MNADVMSFALACFIFHSLIWTWSTQYNFVPGNVCFDVICVPYWIFTKNINSIYDFSWEKFLVRKSWFIAGNYEEIPSSLVFFFHFYLIETCIRWMNNEIIITDSLPCQSGRKSWQKRRRRTEGRQRVFFSRAKRQILLCKSGVSFATVGDSKLSKKLFKSSLVFGTM